MPKVLGAPHTHNCWSNMLLSYSSLSQCKTASCFTVTPSPWGGGRPWPSLQHKILSCSLSVYPLPPLLPVLHAFFYPHIFSIYPTPFPCCLCVLEDFSRPHTRTHARTCFILLWIQYREEGKGRGFVLDDDNGNSVILPLEHIAVAAIPYTG